MAAVAAFAVMSFFHIDLMNCNLLYPENLSDTVQTAARTVKSTKFENLIEYSDKNKQKQTSAPLSGSVRIPESSTARRHFDAGVRVASAVLPCGGNEPARMSANDWS